MDNDKKMELRSFNVQKVYKECVKNVISDTLIVNKENLLENIQNIESMVEQLPDEVSLDVCHIRADGEQWTPYLQVVKMIVLMGIHIGEIAKVEYPMHTKSLIVKTRIL